MRSMAWCNPQEDDTLEAVRKRSSDALLFGMLMLDDAAMDADDAGADTEEEKARRAAETPRTAARNYTVVSRRRFLAYAVQVCVCVCVCVCARARSCV